MKEILPKFKFKANGVVINAPAAVEKEFVQLGFSASLNSPSANTIVFVNNNKEYLDFLNKQLKNIIPDSVFWIAYPKGTSGIKTDVNRDTIRVTAETFGLATVTAISIDNTWSALRLRPVEKVGK